MFFFVQMLLHNVIMAAMMLIASLIALMLLSLNRQRCQLPMIIALMFCALLMLDVIEHTIRH